MLSVEGRLNLLHQGVPRKTVAAMAGCHPATIQRLALVHGIPTRHQTRWAREHPEPIVAKSRSNREVVLTLGLKSASSQTTLKYYLDLYGLSVAHFETVAERGRRLFVSGSLNQSLTPEQVFIKGPLRGRSTLKRFLHRVGVPYRCSLCDNDGNWNGRPLALQIDHIDGDGCNNLKENLRWICPNCHSQTDTFAGRNVVKQLKMPKLAKPRKTKIAWPPDDVLRDMVQQTPTRDLAKAMGVTDAAISKRCKKHGIPKPSCMEWARRRARSHPTGPTIAE